MSLKLQLIINKATELARKELFFLITFFLTVFLSFFSKPHISAIRWNVIVTLFSLMLVSLAFERCQLLKFLSCLAIGIFKTPRKVGLVMIFATGILAMLVTNDVALLTVVPLTIIMAKVSGEDPFMLIILETLSANIFSALTPFGNPQNLYLYSYFKIPAAEFFSMMLPFGLFGAVLLVVINFLFNKDGIYNNRVEKPKILDKKLLVGASISFLLNIFSVLRIFDYRTALAVTILIFLLLAPRILRRVDYYLLLTFVLFFLFTDSVTSLPMMKSIFTTILNTKYAVLLFSAGISQVISNVPAAVLISGFTTNYKELVYGVSAGGLGTLVASLASLISYKLYKNAYKPARYMKFFLIINFSLLLIFIGGIMFMEFFTHS